LKNIKKDKDPRVSNLQNEPSKIAYLSLFWGFENVVIFIGNVQVTVLDINESMLEVGK